MKHRGNGIKIIIVFWVVSLVFQGSSSESASENQYNNENIQAEYLPDPSLYKIAIHFSSLQEATSESSEHTFTTTPHEILSEDMNFHCILPTEPVKLPLFFSSSVSQSKSTSILSEEQMEKLEDMFRPVKSTCFYQMLMTTGTEYMYEFCYGTSLRRGITATDEEFEAGKAERIGRGNLYWKHVEDLGEIDANSEPWWGVVEADEVVLLSTGFSTYFYQWYGENVQIQFHCSDRAAFFHIYEESAGKFIGACGSPIVCNHPLIQRIRNNYSPVDCYLASDEAQTLEIEGGWQIFNGVDKIQYSGMLEMSLLNYHQWGDFGSAIGDILPAPLTVHLHWELDTGEQYDGMALYENAYMCGVWATDWNRFPIVGMYRVSNDGSLRGFWWSVSDFGMDEFLPFAPVSPDINLLHNEFAAVRSFHQDSEYSSMVGSAIIRFNPITEAFRLSYNTDNAYYVGKGMKSGDHLCVVWRQNDLYPNDGLVHYDFDKDKARGSWTLAYAKGIRTEDIVRKKK